MNDNARAFLEAAQADPELCQRLCKMAVGELVAAAREKGFELSEEDFKPAAGELDEADPNNVAGGGGCGCVGAGGGGGTDSVDGSVYGCACVLYGQGGDGRALDSNCVCAPAGLGTDDLDLHTGRDPRCILSNGDGA